MKTPLLLLALAALVGCAAPATIPADRVMVPVRLLGERHDDGQRRLYLEEPSAACDGWYVPKATMIEITNRLEAD